MARRQPAERKSTQTPLRHVLVLGEELLCIAQEAAAEQNRAAKTLLEQSRLILSTTKHLIGGETTLWLGEDVLRSFTGKNRRSLDEWLANVISTAKTPLMEICVEQQQTCAAENSQSSTWWGESDPHILTDAKAIAVPLLMHDHLGQTDRLLGALQVERNNKPGFSAAEAELLEGLAVQASLSLQSSVRMASEDWRREQLRLVEEVSLQIASLRNLNEIARRVTDLNPEHFRLLLCGGIYAGARPAEPAVPRQCRSYKFNWQSG